jgi:glycerol-3-phosphate cytidylyltransferase
MNKERKILKGIIAGNFDVIHPGYIKMFKECSEKCDILYVLLHSDPSIERNHKLPPILSVEERSEILLSLRFIDEILVYTYESELYDILKNGDFHIRFLGDDYINQSFTGDDLKIPIHFLDRSHGWSTTKFKNLIANSVKK